MKICKFCLDFLLCSEKSEIVLMTLPAMWRAWIWLPSNYLQAPWLWVTKGHQASLKLTSLGLKTMPPSNLQHQQTHNPTIKTPKKQQRLLKCERTHTKQTVQTTCSWWITAAPNHTFWKAGWSTWQQSDIHLSEIPSFLRQSKSTAKSSRGECTPKGLG